MRKTIAIPATTLVALLCAASVRAHHSGSMYVTTSSWVGGTVVRFENINPHTITILEEQAEDGQVRRWAVEGPARSQLDRLGIAVNAPKVGDVVEFCGFAYKPVEELSRMFPGVDFSDRRSSSDDVGSAPQFIAGHVLVMPDGEMRLWEPHGVLAECIRSSSEPRQAWVDFLSSDSRAREAWCEQAYARAQSTAALQAVVEEIDSSIDDRCR